MEGFDGSSDKLEVAGYASLFDIEDQAGDVIRPGAFARCLAARGAAGVRMLFQYEAGEPVGVWREIREDARGLYVHGDILAEGPRGRSTRSLVAQGAVDGLSIGFRTVRYGPRPGGRGRELFELDLWEVSIVTFPMLAQARLQVLTPPEPTGLSEPVFDPLAGLIAEPAILEAAL